MSLTVLTLQPLALQFTITNATCNDYLVCYLQLLHLWHYMHICFSASLHVCNPSNIEGKKFKIKSVNNVQFSIVLEFGLKFKNPCLCTWAGHKKCSGLDGQVDFLSGQVTCHSHLSDGQRIRQGICQLNYLKSNLRLAHGKQNLRTYTVIQKNLELLDNIIDRCNVRPGNSPTKLTDYFILILC